MIIFLQIRQTHYLVIAIMLLVGILLSVIVFMLAYLLFRAKRERNKAKWKKNTDLLLQRAIFFEEEELLNAPLPVTPKIRKWLRKAAFRQFLIDELIKARKSLSGSATENLRKLYMQLQLDKASEQKLASLKWHIKARGIQELAMMDQKDRLFRIYRMTNHPVEFIRMEAQLAIVQLYGFVGLRFLDVVSLPISEWQQIKLLAQLPKMSTDPIKGIGKWLQSSNDTVVLFSLKLVAIHHRFELHDQVAACLEHANRTVRIQAVKSLQDINNESTGDRIIKPYAQNGKRYQIAVLETLQQIGTQNELAFLKKELLNEDDALKLAAARALLKLSEKGIQWLDSFKQAGRYPWNEIIQQAKNEIAA